MKGKTVHFIGVGGVGVGALAMFALRCGAVVTGSDAVFNDMCRKLALLGADIRSGAQPTLAATAQLVVFSSAIRPEHPERVAAHAANVPLLERQQFLYEVSKLFGTVATVAGTHGKTTTSAMLSHILKLSQRRFLAMIGGQSVDYGNYIDCLGKLSALEDAVFVAEACEYKRNFLYFDPTVGIVTNVECDHPDCYADIDEVRQAFTEYLKKSHIRVLPADMLPLLGIETPSARGDFDIAVCCDDKLEEIYSVRFCGDDECLICGDGGEIGRVRLADGGEYNLKNAAFAIICATLLGVDGSTAIQALSSFGGVKRRFEFACRIDGVPVYFDFAHHPTEIANLLKRARRYGKILAVFQPHTFSRTKAYLGDFARALSDADYILIMPVYAARETADMGCDSDALIEQILLLDAKKKVYLEKSKDKVCDFVIENAKNFDIALFIGAGDIYAFKDVISEHMRMR